jgi:signal transduction histidine kinase
LAQVLTNLLNNAAKYTPDGGRIEVTAGRDGATVVVRVVDTGVGIPADMLPRVFDLFTQVGRSLDRAQGGLGIGLSLVQKLVGMHGGTVTAESPGPGLGSTFAIRLPAG